MSEFESKSFAEVTLIEAAARRLRADLVMKPVTPDGETRLISRFIGVESPQRVILAPPVTARGRKVFVPDDWELGISFDLANVWFQAATRVIEHCLFYRSPTTRIDALAVAMPANLHSRNRRQSPRHDPPTDAATFATIWPVDRIEDENLAPLAKGRLQDFSATGLGVRLGEPIDLPTGMSAVICLETSSGNESAFLRGILRHCSPLGDGNWVVGFGDITGLEPGEAINLMTLLAAPAESRKPTP